MHSKKKQVKKKNELWVWLSKLAINNLIVIYLGLVLVAGFFYSLNLDKSSNTHGEVKGVSYPYTETYEDHCSYRGDVPAGDLCGEYQTRNLVSEDSSFEFGVSGIYDSISVTQRLHYDYYNPGSGDIFSNDSARGLVMTTLTDEDSYNGNYSLKFDNRNAGGASIDLNYITAPETGRYVFSVWLKATEVGGQVDNNDTCSNTSIGVRLRIYNDVWENYTEGSGQFSVAPGEGWKRVYIVTTSDPMIQAGEIFHPELLVSSTIQPQCWGMGVLLVDAIQFEYALNQNNPAPSDYIYQTSQQELFAYTSTDAEGLISKNGNFYWLDDGENIYSQLEILEQASLETDSKIKWQLYDSSGDYFDTNTALDQGEILVSHDVLNRQTITQDLSSIIATAAPSKFKGWFTLAYELWTPDESKMLDKEFLVLGIAKKSPYRDQDIADSFFGNHVSLGLLDISSTYDHYYFSANRPLNEYLEIARDLGIKYSREFPMIVKDNIEGGIDEDPYLDDYVEAATNHHISLMPVIGGEEGPAGTWQQFVGTAVEHYGDAINAYEVLNEPNSLEVEEYYAYLWRAEEAIHDNQDTIENKVVGPSRGDEWFDELLGYNDGTHASGYELFDVFAPHYYNRFQHGFRQIPEDGSYTGYVDIDDSINTWLESLDDSAPGGENTKPSWNSEFGYNHSRIYPDMAMVNGVPAWTGDSEWQQWNNMSGSIPMARKVTSDVIRTHLYLIAHGINKGFFFGLFNTYAPTYFGYSFFQYDNTPMITATAYAQMTTLLENSDYIRRIETGDLRTNEVLDDYSRAFVFETPDLDFPGQTVPVAAVFNYDQEYTGAGLEDVPIDANNVDVIDMEGNPIDIGSGSSFDVNIDFAPIYIIGHSGMTVAELIQALDQNRPSSPVQPSVTRYSGDYVSVQWTANAEGDINYYNVYRKNVDTEEEVLINMVEQTDDSLITYLDEPTTGNWQYRITAVEQGTDFETAPSEYSTVLEFSYRPVLAPIGAKEGAEGEFLAFDISATDSDSGTLNFVLFNGPAGSNLENNGDKTATFSWTPDYDQAASYPLVIFSVSDGLTSDVEYITITIANTNRLPDLIGTEDKNIHEMDILEFTVIATDEDTEDTLVLTADNLPEGASFIDNGDRTGTFSWQPDTEQSGVYSDVTFNVTDDYGSADSDSITITVLDGISDCTADWQCTNWSICVDNYQTRQCSDLNDCGADADKPDEIQSCDSTPPGRITDLKTL